jgi:hypothetical protein
MDELCTESDLSWHIWLPVWWLARQNLQAVAWFRAFVVLVAVLAGVVDGEHPVDSRLLCSE